MRAATDIRLPGIYFLPTPPAAARGLPPLDVAGFVGFAERGPLHTPVAVDDAATYQAIFGGDLPLALETGGGVAYAHLPTAVSVFFANGGRRCYVVRVAGDQAAHSRFRLPGLISLRPDKPPRLTAVHASSVGRWSERLRLAARLDATPLPANVFAISDVRELLWFTGSAPLAVRPGDLLRLSVSDAGDWLFPVAAIDNAPAGSRPGTVRLTATNLYRLYTPDHPPEPATSDATARLTLNGPQPLSLYVSLFAEGNHLWLHLSGPDAGQIVRGDILYIKLPAASGLLFPVSEIQSAEKTASPPSGGRLASAETALLLDPNQSLPPAGSPPRRQRVERLRFDLHLWQGQTKIPPLLELAFNAGHPRFWGESILAESGDLRQPASETENAAARVAAIYRQLQQERRSRRAPSLLEWQIALAGRLAPLDEAASGDLHLPLAMAAILDPGSRIGPAAADVGQDDLDRFHAGLFVDRDLVPRPEQPASSGAALLSQAFHKQYVTERRLRGMHSLLFIDEVALLAVPDAARQPWPAAESQGELSPIEPPPPPPPAAAFLNCDRPPSIAAITPAEAPPAGQIEVVITGANFAGDAQVLFGDQPATNVRVLHSGAILCAVPPTSAGDALEVVVDIAVTGSRGAAALPAAFAYRQPTVPPLPLLRPADDDGEILLQIQRALLNVAQARRDVVAILSLPRHFDKRLCIDWLANLRQQLGLSRHPVPGLDDAGAPTDLSYAAVYHPWPLIEEGTAAGRLRPIPPDGVICGAIAARERQRQVWIAPANTPLQGVAGLALNLNESDWADLFEFHFNLIRPATRDFRVMSAHTLSDDRRLQQLSVRRLMILLRKMAQEKGMDFVFESNDARLREGIQLSLEVMLQSMFARGAFAGRNSRQAFRVVTGESVNSRQSVEQGQLIAQIQVAPSQPMEFITVLLLRQNEGRLQAAES